jgi:hypothetical protein
VLGSVMSMPVGALLAGPVASAVGVSATQYAAAGIILAASGLTLLSRDIRTRRSTDTPATITASADTVTQPVVAGPAIPAVAQSALPAAAISSDA